MIVEVNGEEKTCNLLIVDNGVCQIFEEGTLKSINIQTVNIRKIVVVGKK